MKYLIFVSLNMVQYDRGIFSLFLKILSADNYA